MTRRTGILAALVVVVGVVLGCAQHGGIQPRATPSARAAVEEATRLDALVEELYSKGKFQEAIPLADRSLALREQVRGPRHPDVAKSLHNLAVISLVQGAYAKAEPLSLRALDILDGALGECIRCGARS